MRPIFSVHAGEFLVGNEIERRFPDATLWLPAKDTGVDFLVTNAAKSQRVTLQVKYSRDFSDLHKGLTACGWFTLKRTSILRTPADLWIFVLWSPSTKAEHRYILIPPKELLKRLTKIHGKEDRINTYFWVARTDRERCWEGRNLGRREEVLIAQGLYREPKRDFTTHLNAWQLLASRLGTRLKKNRLTSDISRKA